MRRSKAEVRERMPDAKFGDLIIGEFINKVMYSGKKSVAEKIVYGALELVETRSKEDAVKMFHTALENVGPHLEVKSRRVGGANYQVPMEVRPTRRIALAIRWLIDASRKRGEKTMVARLAAELLDAAQNRGSAVKKREDVHKMAEANRAFAHFRFG
jgi:small subunit ribosomal protein S7